MRPGPSQLRNYWIWYIGSAVWMFDALLALRLEHYTHARSAIFVALLFLVAGAVWRRKSDRIG